MIRPSNALVGLGLTVGCGPTVSLDEPRVPPAAVDSGSTTVVLPSLGSGSGSSRGINESTTSVSGASEVADDAEPPRLDVPSRIFDTMPPPMDVPMYGACWGDGLCEPGLDCVVLAYEKLIEYAICTAVCEDPAADCAPAPAGWEAICALHVADGQLDVCAIECDTMQQCPEGRPCIELFGPRGEVQHVCGP